MPQDRAAVPADQPAPIKVPDQVQQAKRSDAPRHRPAPTDASRPAGGVLHELETQRAHD
jgi:hypothetical protein